MGNYLQRVKRCQISRKILSIFLAAFLLFPSFLSPSIKAFSFFGFGTKEVKIYNTKDLPQISIEKWVGVLVEEKLYNGLDIKEKIDRYATDAATAIGGRSVMIPIPSNASPKEIYEGLAELYFMGPNGDGKAQLDGIVLIGDIPIPVVEKGGRYWPTIFPYTDFESPVYYWDNEEDRFIFDRSATMKADIWHGVIRSQKDSFSEQVKEIAEFLDQNHKVHTGETTFANKTLYVDTQTQNNLPAILVDRYVQWVKYLEEIVYKRYTKVLLKEIEENLNKNNPSYVEHEIPASVQNELITTLTTQLSIDITTAKKLIDNIGDGIPDIRTPDIAKLLAGDFETVNSAWTNVILDQIEATGVWSKDEIDTTIKLVTTKDKLSALQLKMVNDKLESDINQLLETYNVAEHISVKSRIVLTPPDEGKDSSSLLPEEKPLYWNGIEREGMTSENCSLYRGIVPDKETPFAQQVIANRTLDVETVDTCVFSGESKSKKEGDEYAGCCINNLYQDGGETLSNCDTGSVWVPSVGGTDWVHQGAVKPIFNMAGTRLESGPDGALGCEDILANENEDPDFAYRFNSLKLHIEPTLETRAAQLKTGAARALPVDDPRGFSFYDHGRDFQRIDFINIFDFRKKVKSHAQLESELLAQITTKVAEINRITSQGNEISNNRYELDKKSLWPIAVYELPKDLNMTGGCQYTRKFAQTDPFTRQITWSEDCDYASPSTVPPEKAEDPIQVSNKVIRFYEVGKLIPNNQAELIFKQIDTEKLYESITWIDQTIDNKSQQVLNQGLGEAEKAQEFFTDPTINGYQLVHFSTEQTDGDELIVGFAPDSAELDEEFLEARSRNIGFVSAQDKYAPKLLGTPVDDIIENGATVVVKDQIARILTPTNLKNSRSLSVSPKVITASKSGYKPIPITFTLKNKKGQVQKDDYKHEVEIKFSSSDVDKFFEVLPSRKVKLNGGVAKFYLKPKTKRQNVGARFSVSGMIDDEVRIISKVVPITVSRYDSRLTTTVKSIGINDRNGVRITMKVVNEKGELSNFLDGANLNFTTTLGSFAGGINTAQVANGVATIRFFPGTKSGPITITASHPKGVIPSAEVKLEVLPGKADHLQLETDDHFFVKGTDFYPVTVSLRDRFGNKVMEENHELSWQIKGAEVENRSERDLDPRRNGIQEWVTTPNSTLNLKPTGKTIELAVRSSLFDDKKSIAKTYVVAQDPVLDIDQSKEFLIAGSGEAMKVTLRTTTNTSALIKNELEVKTLVMPANFLHLPAIINVKNGFAFFEIAPGTKAGTYQVHLLSDGFVTKTIEVEVRPAVAKKIKLSTTKTLWDKDEDEVLLDMVLVDAFGNKVLEDIKAGLRTTRDTKELVKIDSEDVTLRSGETQIKVKPLGTSGEVHLIAEGGGVFGDTLSLRLTDLLDLDEVSSTFAPKSIFTLLTGTPAANLLKDENVANRLLFAGKTQAIGSLSAPMGSVKKGYGSIGEDGSVSGKIQVKLILGKSIPEVLILNASGVMARLNFIYKDNLDVYFEGQNTTKGVVISPNKEVRGMVSKLTLDHRTLRLEDEALVSFAKAGGVRILSPNISLKIDNNNFKKWKIQKGRITLATFEYNLDSTLQNGTSYIAGEFEGVLLESLASNIRFEPIFTGNSTNAGRGFTLVDRIQKASNRELLGQPNASAEETETEAGQVWTGNWNPAGLFAAGNTIGESVTRGGSDAFLLLGDPTLSRAKEESDEGIGQPIWENESAPIDDILLADINGNGDMDLLARVGTELFGLYNSGKLDGKFIEVGPLMKLDGGIKSLSILSDNKGGSTEGYPSSFVQINNNGEFVFHENKQGKFTSEVMPFAQKFKTIKSANFDGNQYEDLAALDKNQQLWKILQNKDGFDSPIFIADLSPRFDTINEQTNQSEDTKYIKEIGIIYNGIEEVKSLSEANLKTKFQLKTKTGGASIGTIANGILKLESAKTLGNVRLVIPEYKHLRFESKTLRCLECNQAISTKTNSISGDIYIYIPEILKDTPMTLYWDMAIDSLEETKFFVGDFEEGKDKIDDIIVPWDEGGEIKLRKFLSSDSNITTRINWKEQALKLKNIVGSFFSKTVFAIGAESIDDTIKPEPKPDQIVSEEDLATRVYIKEGQADYFAKDELLKPNSVTPVESCDVVKPSKTIGDAAPGLNFVYDSSKGPYAKPDGNLEAGAPKTRILTTRWTPHGPVPAVNKIGVGGIDSVRTASNGVYVNPLRVYDIPTTTGKTVTAMCRGLYFLHMKVGLWLPNCYVLSVPRAGDIVESCKSGQTDPIKVATQAEQIITTKNGENIVLLNEVATQTPGSVRLEKKNKSNYKAPAVGQFSQWMNDQFRYFSQELEKVLPDVSSIGAENRVQKSIDTKGIGRDSTEVSRVTQQLNETLSITINTKEITVSVPKVPAGSILTEAQQSNLDSYTEIRKEVLNKKRENIEILANAAEIARITTEYDRGIEKRKQKTFRAYAQSGQLLQQLYNLTRSGSSDVSARFTETYKTNAVDRGTWLSWLYENLAGKVDTSVITFDTYPDITIDTSNALPGGIVVNLVDIKLKEIEVEPKAIKPYHADIYPKSDMVVTLPSFPTVPEPPALPLELFEAMMARMETPRSFMGLFGQMRLGVAPVPEWGLKPYVEQLTNRDKLYNYDRRRTADIDINTGLGTDATRQDDHPDILEANIMTPLQKLKVKALAFKPQNKEQELFRLAVLDLELPLLPNNPPLPVGKKETNILETKQIFLAKNLEKIESIVHLPMDEFMLAYNTQRKPTSYFTANPKPVLEKAEILNFKVVENNDETTLESVSSLLAENGLYIQNKETGELKKLLHQDLLPNAKVVTFDIDEDGDDEIFYTNGGRIYIKGLSKDTVAAVELIEEQDDRVSTTDIVYWTYKKFRDQQDVARNIEPTATGITFEPVNSRIDYYEWFVSDRPDSVFEMTKKPEKRISNRWERHGFIKQILLEDYRINKAPAVITRVEGKPKIMTVKSNRLSNYDREDCADRAVSKPLFDTRSVLTAKKDSTKLEIRVPARQFKPSDYQTIVLNKGESTSIDYGEVCVFDGALEVIKLIESPTAFIPKIGMSILTEMETQMTANSFIQLRLGDGSLIDIYGADKYLLHFFDPSDNPIGYGGLGLHDENLYGFLMGIEKGKRTVVRRKLLHPSTR